VAIRYVSVGTASDGAEARRKVAWFGEETFVPHLLQLLTCPYIEVRVSFGEPILPPHTDRRSLSAEAERQVRALGNLPFMEVAKEPEEPDEPVIEDAGCGVG